MEQKFFRTVPKSQKLETVLHSVNNKIPLRNRRWKNLVALVIGAPTWSLRESLFSFLHRSDLFLAFYCLLKLALDSAMRKGISTSIVLGGPEWSTLIKSLHSSEWRTLELFPFKEVHHPTLGLKPEKYDKILGIDKLKLEFLFHYLEYR